MSYPVAYIQDRYGGCYSGGAWLRVSTADAPITADEAAKYDLPRNITRVEAVLVAGPSGDDTEACEFWYDPPKWIVACADGIDSEAGNPQLEQVAKDARQAFTSPAFRQMPKPRRAGYALAGAWKSKIGEEPSHRQAMEIARQCNALNRWQLTTDQVSEAADAMRKAYAKTIGKVDVASFAEQVKEAFERHAPPADQWGVLTLASGAELTKLEWQVLAMAALIQHARDGQPVVTAQSAWGKALGVNQPRISDALSSLCRDGFLADAGTGYMPPSGGKRGRAKQHHVTPKGMDAMAPVLADHLFDEDREQEAIQEAQA